MPRGRPKSKNKEYYWTKDTDALILHYNALEEKSRKDRYYATNLYKIVQKLSNEVLKYVNGKYTPNWSGEEQDEAVLEMVTFITERLPLYTDITKSGYAYFGTIAKHHYLDILTRRTSDQNRFIPLDSDIDDEDENYIPKVGHSLFDVDSDEEIQAYKDRMIEHFNSFKFVDSDTKLVFSEIIKYLQSDPIPDMNGMKVHLVNNIVDKGLLQDWKIDRLLAPYDIFFALKDRSDYRETKKDKLADNNWEWIYEVDEQTPYQKERARFFARKNIDEVKQKRKESWKKKIENETKEER